MKEISTNIRFNRRYLLFVLIFLLALYVLLPQLGQFSDSWRYLRSPDLGWLMLSIGLTTLTYFFAALTYRLLAFKGLGYVRLVVIQLAAMFVNRLLPGGLGALGTNFVYLKRNRHTTPQATSVVAVNNLLGFVGHGLLLLLVVTVVSPGVELSGRYDIPADSFFKFAAPALLILLVGSLWGRKKFLQGLAQTGVQLLSYSRRKGRLGLALLSSCGLTLCNVLALYACASALGIDLSLGAIMLIFTLGVGLGTAVPTPGGLGAFEAGLVAGFVAYDIEASAALAAALLYRLIAYWLTILAGALALVYAQRRDYI